MMAEKAKKDDPRRRVDALFPEDVDARTFEVFLMHRSGDLEAVLAPHPRLRKFRIGGADWEHTHETTEGAWVYRAL